MNQKIDMRARTKVAEGPPSDPLFWAAEKLKEAETLRKSKNLTRARRICADLLERFPEYVGALHTLGLVLADMEKYEESVAQLSKAAMYCPLDWRILTALSNVNLQLGRVDTARVALEQAQKLKPDDPVILGTLAEIYRNQKDYELAAQTFEQFLAVDSSVPSTRKLLADCYEHLGWLEKAAAIYETMVAEDLLDISVVSGIAQLPAGFTTLEPVSLLEKIPEAAKDDLSSYKFARGFALHRAGRYDEAWPLFVDANQESRREIAQEWEATADYRRKSLEFAKSLPELTEAPPLSEDHPVSLFILGPSRSGKTTLERAVSNLTGVKRGYENPIVENNVRRTLQVSGCITRTGINGMPPALDATFQGHYLDELRERADGAKVFTNTHPGKLTEVMRYARSLPGCRVVFVKRDPMDLTLRIYMKSYASGNAYAYDLKTIREHIDWYYGLMDICMEKLPHMCVMLNYEDIIEDPGAALNKVANLCGIDGVPSELPAIGDDRGAAEPYKDRLNEALT